MSSDEKRFKNLKAEVKSLKALVRKLRRRLRQKAKVPRSQRSAFKEIDDDDTTE